MSIFNRTGALNPSKSVFDLSYNKMFTCDMGDLIPVQCDEVVPGDVFNMGCQVVLRFQPLVSPILHEINMYAHTFFVPYRLLWDGWEDFITGGRDGTDASTLPTWNATDRAVGSLWDYMGFPPNVAFTDCLPLDFPKRAYNLINKEYYFDETLDRDPAFDINTTEIVFRRCWEKDYFTSSLPWQQRGVTPAVPFAPGSQALWHASVFTQKSGIDVAGAEITGVNVSSANQFVTYDATMATAYNTALNTNQVVGTFDINDLRLAFQIQKWMERNARCGIRYNEFIMAHFGVHAGDDRLQRPEYIGGTRNPIIVSEVLQTSESDTTPQGNLAGHGIGINNGFIGKYRVKEFGLIMTLFSVLPRTAYQQGIDRQWLRRTRFDFPFPEFANLSEQAVLNAELYVKPDATYPTFNNDIFGYQGRFDEMRIKKSMICGEMRTTFDHWHLARQWVDTDLMLLDEMFIHSQPRKDIFAVPSEPGLIVNFGNIIKAYRPIPILSNPGLIDHV